MIDEKVASSESLILASRSFRSKPQMKRLLGYLVQNTVNNNDDALQQRNIAISCLGRNNDFESSKDPIVRIEAARLRRLLEAYYESDTAKQTPLRIMLPKGSYRLVFSRNIEHRLSRSFSLLLLCQSPMVTNVEEIQLMMKIRQDLSFRMNHFDHFNLAVNFHPEHEVAQRGSIHFLAEEQHDYVMRLEVVQDREKDFLVSTIVVHRITQEILWSQSTTIPQGYDSNQLDAFYSRLISPLIADSYGLLGIHWAKSCIEMGLDYVEDQQMVAVQFFNLCSDPIKADCERFLSFLDQRLQKYPDDFNAQGSYLAIGFFDYFLNYELMPTSLEERLKQCLIIEKYASQDAGVSVLIGIYYFALNRYTEAESYLNAAIKLNPYNPMWEFIYNGLLFFTGKREQGFKRLQKLARRYETLPSYYFIPVYIYRLGHKEWEKVFATDDKTNFAENLECLVKSLTYPYRLN